MTPADRNMTAAAINSEATHRTVFNKSLIASFTDNREKNLKQLLKKSACFPTRRSPAGERPPTKISSFHGKIYNFAANYNV